MRLKPHWIDLAFDLLLPSAGAVGTQRRNRPVGTQRRELHVSGLPAGEVGAQTTDAQSGAYKLYLGGKLYLCGTDPASSQALFSASLQTKQ